MRDPYKVIVWGPGDVGKSALKIMHGRPEFEVVGVLCHSFGKHGVDVGQYLGYEATGLQMTRDREAIFALDADVVLYTGLFAFDQAKMDADMMQLLESGKNVISVTAYNYPHYHGQEYVDRLEAACRKGNSSLHGTGELPGFFLDRVALTMTGVCREVRHLKLEEWYNISRSTVSQLGFLGVNQTLEHAQQTVPQLLEGGVKVAQGEALTMMARTLFDRTPEIGLHADFAIAEEDIHLPKGLVAKGKVSDLKFTFTASIDGEVRLTTVLNWTFTKPERWLIEIEGDPVSVRADINGYASLDGEQMYRPGDTLRVGSYCTAMPAVQAIPMVCDAPPGVVYPTVFTNAMPDMRALATRSSIGG